MGRLDKDTVGRRGGIERPVGQHLGWACAQAEESALIGGFALFHINGNQVFSHTISPLVFHCFDAFALDQADRASMTSCPAHAASETKRRNDYCPLFPPRETHRAEAARGHAFGLAAAAVALAMIHAADIMALQRRPIQLGEQMISQRHAIGQLAVADVHHIGYRNPAHPLDAAFLARLSRYLLCLFGIDIPVVLFDRQRLFGDEVADRLKMHAHHFIQSAPHFSALTYRQADLDVEFLRYLQYLERVFHRQNLPGDGRLPVGFVQRLLKL